MEQPEDPHGRREGVGMAERSTHRRWPGDAQLFRQDRRPGAGQRADRAADARLGNAVQEHLCEGAQMIRLAAALLAVVLAAPLEAHAQDRTRRVHFTAVDRNGAVVTDLAAAEVTVKEGGKSREITAVRPATEPLQVAILVDDNGTGIFRVPVGRFIEGLLGRAAFSIVTVAGQPRALTPFTGNSDTLREAIAQLIARPASPDGGQLLSGIHESALDFERRKVERPVIVALTVGGEEHAPLPPHHV